MRADMDYKARVLDTRSLATARNVELRNTLDYRGPVVIRLDSLREARGDINWTYMCIPRLSLPAGERTVQQQPSGGLTGLFCFGLRWLHRTCRYGPVGCACGEANEINLPATQKMLGGS